MITFNVATFCQKKLRKTPTKETRNNNVTISMENLECLFVKGKRGGRRNKYLIFTNGEQLFFGKETRHYFMLSNEFDMILKNPLGQRVVQLIQPHSFLSDETMKVYSPPGTLIGQIVHKFNLNVSKLDICDAEGRILYKINGPKLPLLASCEGDQIEFKIINFEGSHCGVQIGRITKNWTGFIRTKENLENTNYFDIFFPQRSSVQVKTVLIGASIFIDLLHYTSSKSSPRSGIVSNLK